jgi:hypothetical protein
MKIPRAIENLKDLITSRGGTIIITLPLGYNPVLDKLLKGGVSVLEAIQFDADL